MIGQITTTPQHLKEIDYADARITNLYITTLDTSEEVINEATNWSDLRKHIFQCMSTPDLLSGNFSSVTENTTRGIRSSSANQIMHDVLKALPMIKYACSIAITLNDGRKVTINENFPINNTWNTWKASYIEFAKKFVMG